MFKISKIVGALIVIYVSSFVSSEKTLLSVILGALALIYWELERK